jgi:hypothetical protein
MNCRYFCHLPFGQAKKEVTSLSLSISFCMFVSYVAIFLTLRIVLNVSHCFVVSTFPLYCFTHLEFISYEA